jgi:HPt (histidine-containing phosphotransfer) domain-containing protein
MPSSFPILTLHYLRSITLNEVPLIVELLEIFVEDGQMYLDQLEAAQDQKAVIYAVHTLKGTAGQIGAERFEAYGAEAERLARDDKRWKEAQAYLGLFRDEFKAVCEAIEEYKREEGVA